MPDTAWPRRGSLMVGHMVTDRLCSLQGRKEIKMQRKGQTKRILTPMPQMISSQNFRIGALGIDASKDKADTPVVARVAGGDCNQ